MASQELTDTTAFRQHKLVTLVALAIIASPQRAAASSTLPHADPSCLTSALHSQTMSVLLISSLPLMIFTRRRLKSTLTTKPATGVLAYNPFQSVRRPRHH